MTEREKALEAALVRIERLAGLVAHDLTGRVEAGKVAAVQQCSDVARAALAIPAPKPQSGSVDRASWEAGRDAIGLMEPNEAMIDAAFSVPRPQSVDAVVAVDRLHFARQWKAAAQTARFFLAPPQEDKQ
jgi:hypothetical protein